VRATGPKTNAAQRKFANSEGRRSGCWSCGTKSATHYVADHYPASVFYRKNGIKGRQYILPQCYVCSARQGGFLSRTQMKNKGVNRGLY
jgi:hypothetical protein